MNLLLLEEEEIDAQGRVELSGRRAEHLRQVLKVEPGRRLKAGILGGGRGQVEVLRVSAANVCLSYRDSGQLAAAPWADLILALPRPAVLHRLLQMAAAMRISRLHLLRSWRVEKSFFSSPALRLEAIRKHLILGAEQGMVTRLPEVRIHHRLVPFLEELASRAEPGHHILAHPGSEHPLESAFADGRDPRSSAPVQLAIGPEGGWIDREVESFCAIGFRALSLGPWVLRVETAVAVALGQIEMARRRVIHGDKP